VANKAAMQHANAKVLDRLMRFLSLKNVMKFVPERPPDYTGRLLPSRDRTMMASLASRQIAVSWIGWFLLHPLL
jgi:hypothetical protein